MHRRTFLRLIAGSAFAGILTARAQFAKTPSSSSKTVEALQRDWKLLLARDAKIASDATPVSMTYDGWQRVLSPAAYNVLRHEGTERAFTSPLTDEHRRGVFACAGCALPLFTSDMKFDSGTGWPSFFTTIPNVFVTKTDTKLLYPRTEYHCVKCGGHHGHVFDDGPQPTGQRWCNNGVALRFIPLTT